MKSHEEKNKVINAVIAQAHKNSIPQEGVEHKYWNGAAYLNADHLITWLTLNSKRKGLSKAEVDVFNRTIAGIKKYKENCITAYAGEPFFDGDEIEYIGGQGEGETPVLEKDKIYHTAQVTEGKFGTEWHPAVVLAEFPGDDPTTRPAFNKKLFRKVKCPKIVSMDVKKA